MPARSPSTLSILRHFSLCAIALTTAFAAANHAHAQATLVPTRALFQSMAPNATNVINFQEFNYSPATGSGLFSTPLTELGFVQFRTTSNYSQEVIEGTNVGQPGNIVYTTLAADKTQTIADITFGNGVLALGLDFKDTAGNGTAGLVPQPFTLNLFSGTTSLGSFTLSTISGGTMFTFAGFTSSAPITELTITSTNVSPNQDIVLDNFALSNQVPEPGTTAFVGLGLVGLVLVRRVLVRRNRRALA